ncbi:copper resistance D family protein [Ornithinimicrobium sp. INDO-MA30-4]|uniref:copper resistance D family protein n=1 Tax=Ornithinimicrobium sp. INDO-MA30-4 TaxID=2908651 RepID=UPI001F365EE3|nr:CopD family protein [Ornithinimicrobium sp. INDO-MA30-4]UJH69796.1 CopD family protein [Ornithinimicrobium sp. INDO-MA30-4]
MATLTQQPNSAETSNPPGMRWLPVAVLVASALTLALPLAAWSGATAELLLGDVGPLVRWGMIVVGVLHDAAAAVTVGLLVVGGFLVPEGRHSHRRESAARAAALTAIVWALAAAVKLVFSFAEGSGQALSTPGFIDNFFVNVLAIDLFRYQLIEVILVIGVVLMAGSVRTRNGLAWAGALAVGALMPVAYTGHSGDAEGHETAVTALGLHLLGVTLWAGGLIALLMLRPQLGKALKVTVERYSTMALWCFIAVGFSGVLFALQSADDWSDLGSSYWLLIFAKTALMAVLGWFGWTQRRRIIDRGVDKPGAFARLATSEIVVMGAAIGVAVTLSRTPPPLLDESGLSDPAFALTGFRSPPPLEASSWLTVWELNWLFLLTALLPWASIWLASSRCAAAGIVGP